MVIVMVNHMLHQLSKIPPVGPVIGTQVIPTIGPILDMKETTNLFPKTVSGPVMHTTR